MVCGVVVFCVLDSRLVGIIVGRCDAMLPFCSPSRVIFCTCRMWSALRACSSICVRVLKSSMVLFPKSIPMMVHLPPLCLSSRSWKCLNVLSCLDVRSLDLCLHLPRRCVFVSDWLHLPHNISPFELCLFLHR
jgi:hypothetical protein